MSNLYSIYDVKSSLWSPPFCCRRNVEATRMFESLVKDNQSTVSKYPSEFCLYLVGEFNDETGNVIDISHTLLNYGNEFENNNVG